MHISWDMLREARLDYFSGEATIALAGGVGFILLLMWVDNKKEVKQSE